LNIWANKGDKNALFHEKSWFFAVFCYFFLVLAGFLLKVDVFVEFLIVNVGEVGAVVGSAGFLASQSRFCDEVGEG